VEVRVGWVEVWLPLLVGVARVMWGVCTVVDAGRSGRVLARLLFGGGWRAGLVLAVGVLVVRSLGLVVVVVSLPN